LVRFHNAPLPVLMDKIDVPLENITIIDFEDKLEDLKNYTDQGLKYFREKNYTGKFRSGFCQNIWIMEACSLT